MNMSDNRPQHGKTGRKTVHQKGRTARTARSLTGAAVSAALLMQSVWIAPPVWASEAAPQQAAAVQIASAVQQSAAAQQSATEKRQVVVQQSAASTAQQSAIRMVSEVPVTAGATLRTYEYTTVRSGQKVKTEVNMIVVDLQNPYVSLSVMNGLGNNLHSRQNVLGMAKETGAVAGINGDYFHTTKPNLPPIGPVIDDGKWLATPLFAQGYYMFGISKDRKPVIDFYKFQGQVTAPDGATYPIRGINRMATWQNGQLSHVDSIFIYTPEWGVLDRGDDPNYIHNEILVKDGIVQDMVFNDTFDFLVPEDSLILRVNRKAAEFFQNHVQIGDRIGIEYDLIPSDPDNPVRGQDLQMLIGGHTLLVDEGKPAAFTADVSGIGGARSRTGVGYSRDGRYVYLITADNSGDSKGMTVKEFQDFMVLAGVWRGMNLDGGGSTQLVSRPLGEYDVVLVNRPEFGSMRNVANGIGVYTHAPQGELKGLILDGPEFIFINELATYTAKAYDTYYNPIDASTLPIKWTVTDDGAQESDNQLTPTRRGMARVTATSGQVRQSMTIPVVGRQDLQQIEIVSSSQVFAEGKTYDISVYATTRSGLKREIPSEIIEWEFIGFEGVMEDGRLTVTKQTDGAVNRLIARYDDFGAMLTVPAGVEKLWADFSTLNPPVKFNGYPSEVTGWARVMNGVPGTDLSNNVLHLAYDFYDGEGTKAAYAEFNDGKGIQIEGAPTAMKLKLMGDNSRNWVRAEFVDANGKSHLVDIAQGVNWYGFKDVEVDLTKYDMAYPITLKRLYIANPAERQDEREKFGAVAFDDIAFFVQGKLPQEDFPKVELVIGRNKMTVGGKEMAIDQAPVLTNGTTLVPVRFIVDALNGEVFWDGTKRKVTLIKGEHLVEMWIGEQEILIDGKRVPSRVAPLIMNGRTMVPLRLIADAFGWDVKWNQKEQKVTLQ